MANSAVQEFMIDQLKDLYDAEKQLTKALPKLAKSANDSELADGFRQHLEQTKGHVQRIEQIFEQLEMKAKSKPCAAMKGLVQEGQEAIEEELDEPAGDVALIAAGRRVEHYEMAAYETLILTAQSLKMPQVTGLLQETLREENETDKKLSTIAKRLLKEAGRPGPVSGEEEASTKSTGASKQSGASSKSASSKAPSASAGKSVVAPKKSSGKAPASQSSSEDHGSLTTTNHDEIREWAEERGGKPACVRGTGGKGDIGLMRIEFPGKPNSNDDKLEEISWDEFFEKFDERGLALVYQEHTAEGQLSNFNKLVSGESASKAPKSHSAR